MNFKINLNLNVRKGIFLRQKLNILKTGNLIAKNVNKNEPFLWQKWVQGSTFNIRGLILLKCHLFLKSKKFNHMGVVNYLDIEK